MSKNNNKNVAREAVQSISDSDCKAICDAIYRQGYFTQKNLNGDFVICMQERKGAKVRSDGEKAFSRFVKRNRREAIKANLAEDIRIEKAMAKSNPDLVTQFTVNPMVATLAKAYAIAKKQGTLVYTEAEQATLPDALIHLDEATGFWMDDAGNIYL